MAIRSLLVVAVVSIGIACLAIGQQKPDALKVPATPVPALPADNKEAEEEPFAATPPASILLDNGVSTIPVIKLVRPATPDTPCTTCSDLEDMVFVECDRREASLRMTLDQLDESMDRLELAIEHLPIGCEERDNAVYAFVMLENQRARTAVLLMDHLKEEFGLC